MEKYLATQIIAGRLDYNKMVLKYPKLKDKLDNVLKERGYVVNDGRLEVIS